VLKEQKRAILGRMKDNRIRETTGDPGSLVDLLVNHGWFYVNHGWLYINHG